MIKLRKLIAILISVMVAMQPFTAYAEEVYEISEDTSDTEDIETSTEENIDDLIIDEELDDNDAESLDEVGTVSEDSVSSDEADIVEEVVEDVSEEQPKTIQRSKKQHLRGAAAFLLRMMRGMRGLLHLRKVRSEELVIFTQLYPLQKHH